MTLPQLLTQVLLPIMLALMMFSMGLSLTTKDFKRIANYPKAAFSGILMQLMLLPAIAWGLILLLGIWVSIPPLVTFGILILAACPGGATSNVISHLAGGEGALSISMTAIVSLLIPFIIPVSLAYQLSWLGGEAISLQLPIIKTIMQLLLVTVIPVIIAMVIRHRWSAAVIKVEPVFRKGSGLLFLILVLALMIAQWEKIQQLGWQVAGLCLALCLTAMLASYLIAKLLGFDGRTTKTLSIEVGIQNAGTGIFIAAVLMNQPELALIPLTYGLVMNIPAFVLIGLNYTQKKQAVVFQNVS